MDLIDFDLNDRRLLNIMQKTFNLISLSRLYPHIRTGPVHIICNTYICIMYTPVIHVIYQYPLCLCIAFADDGARRLLWTFADELIYYIYIFGNKVHVPISQSLFVLMIPRSHKTCCCNT